MKKFIFLILMAPLFSFVILAETSSPPTHDHHNHTHEEEHDHAHDGGKPIGEQKAIIEVDESKGFKLSESAIKTLGIQTLAVLEQPIDLPSGSLVHLNDQTFIYRLRDGFFKSISFKLLKLTPEKFYRIESHELKPGDQIAISSTGLLRVTDIFSTDESEYGHAH